MVKVFSDELRVTDIVNKFPTFYRTRVFIVMSHSPSVTFTPEVSKYGRELNRVRVPVDVLNPFVNTVKIAHECASAGP
jgi:hypothetical protein